MRLLVWICLGFSAGCGLGAWWLRGAALVWTAVAALGLMIPAVWFRNRWKPLGAAALVLLGLALGCGVFRGYESRVLAPLGSLDGQTTVIALTASDYSKPTDYGVSVEGTIRAGGRDYRVLLYLDEPWEITPGDMIQLPARLRFTDEGGSMEPTYHRTNGILLLAYQEDAGVVLPGEPEWYHQPAVWRRSLSNLLDRCFPADTRGFARALLLGEKSGLSEDTALSFRLAGLSHIVAVSGLHLSFFFGTIFLLTGKRRWLTALVGIPSVVLFAAVAGFTPSVTRAAGMQILMMLALACNREYDAPTALSVAVMAMLCMNPLVIASAGFQMSVASVAGILLLYPIWWKKLGGEQARKGKNLSRKILRGGISAVSLSLGASVPVLPLVAGYYDTVSLVSVVANLLVVPVVSVIFYGICLVCLLGSVWPVMGTAAAWLVSWLMRYVFAAAEFLGGFPLSAVYTGSVYILIWLAFCYGILAWLLWGKPNRQWPWICACVAGFCLALLLSWSEPLMSSYRVTVLDVGQGQCILLQSRGTTFMVDCGGDSDAQAGDKAAQALLTMGITRIDGLILTHYDRDHCGGVPRLASRITIDRIYLPRTEDTDGLLPDVLAATETAERMWVDTDTDIFFRDCRIRIFAPDSGKSGNESCAAVLFQREKCDTLITGDTNAAGERELLRKGELPDLELLIVGHHGSADSTSAELLYRTAPDAAIISVGRNNPYGHPRQEILNRLERYGIAVFRTDLSGDIMFKE